MSRNTAVVAFQRLRAEGFLDAKHGVGVCFDRCTEEFPAPNVAVAFGTGTPTRRALDLLLVGE